MWLHRVPVQLSRISWLGACAVMPIFRLGADTMTRPHLQNLKAYVDDDHDSDSDLLLLLLRLLLCHNYCSNLVTHDESVSASVFANAVAARAVLYRMSQVGSLA